MTSSASVWAPREARSRKDFGAARGRVDGMPSVEQAFRSCAADPSRAAGDEDGRGSVGHLLLYSFRWLRKLSDGHRSLPQIASFASASSSSRCLRSRSAESSPLPASSSAPSAIELCLGSRDTLRGGVELRLGALDGTLGRLASFRLSRGCRRAWPRRPDPTAFESSSDRSGAWVRASPRLRRSPPPRDRCDAAPWRARRPRSGSPATARNVFRTRSSVAALARPRGFESGCRSFGDRLDRLLLLGHRGSQVRAVGAAHDRGLRRFQLLRGVDQPLSRPWRRRERPGSRPRPRCSASSGDRPRSPRRARRCREGA